MNEAKYKILKDNKIEYEGRVLSEYKPYETYLIYFMKERLF